MMSPEQNDLITRVGPGTKCGALMRHYWHPVALTDELPHPARCVLAELPRREEAHGDVERGRDRERLVDRFDAGIPCVLRAAEVDSLRKVTNALPAGSDFIVFQIVIGKPSHS